MTHANHPHRLNLVTAYAHAYRQASTQGPAAAAFPARTPARPPRPPARLPRTPARPPAGTGQARQPAPARADAMTGPATTSSRKET